LAFSSHADQDELIEWISELDKKTHIYLNHGDPEAKIAFKAKLLSLGFEKTEIAESET
jgi:metallo-beta-lactamase family protein